MSDTLSPPRNVAPGGLELMAVVYSSIATVPFSDVDLALLLSISRRNNAAAGITGLLLHRDGQFMQALEGPVRSVRAALRKIRDDPRHREIWTLDEEYVAERRFGSWAMGYRPLSTSDLAEAPSWFGSPDGLTPQDGSRAAELLAWFRGR